MIKQQNIYYSEETKNYFESELLDDNLTIKLEEIIDEFHSLSVSNDFEFTIQNSSNCNEQENNLNFSIYNLLKNSIALSRAVIDENNCLKNSLENNEKYIDILKKEIIEMKDFCDHYYDLVIEFDKINEENKKLKEKKFVSKEVINKLSIDALILNNKMRVYDENIKIIEIEKEELFNRCESLQEKYEVEVKRAGGSKKILIEKEKEIISLQRKNEELNNIILKMEKLNTNEASNTINSNLNIRDKVNYQSKYSTNCSIYNIISDKNQGLEIQYGSSLSSICSDFNEVDENLEKCKSENKVSIQITPIQVVKKMSQKENLISVERINETIIKNKNDIYKDFFLLTFQSLKLNSEDIEPFIGVNKEKLYEKILQNNIPFHKVNFF